MSYAMLYKSAQLRQSVANMLIRLWNFLLEIAASLAASQMGEQTPTPVQLMFIALIVAALLLLRERR
jgi:hypothetical protein